jgi:mono/diheme cytochrome c family protein
MPQVAGRCARAAASVLTEMAMTHSLFLFALASAPLLLAAPVSAQESAANPGRTLVMSKCFQCHTDAIFRDARQDTRGWEAAIYRMVGRGGLWTSDEIKIMAEYLGSEFGPGSNSSGQTR